MSIISTFPALVPDLGDQDMTSAERATPLGLSHVLARYKALASSLSALGMGPAGFEHFIRHGADGTEPIWATLPPGWPLPLAAQRMLAKLETFAGYDATTVARSVEQISPGERLRFIKAMSNPGIPLSGASSVASKTLETIISGGDPETVSATWDYLWVANLLRNQDTRSSFQKTLDDIGRPFVDWGNALIAKHTTGGTWYTNSIGQTTEQGGNVDGWGILGGEVAAAYQAVTSAISGNFGGVLSSLPVATSGPGDTGHVTTDPLHREGGTDFTPWI